MSLLQFVNFFLMSFANDIDFNIPNVDLNAPIIEDVVSFIPEAPLLIIFGIILIAITIFIIFFLKKFIVNSVLGLAIWAVAVFILNIELPFIPSLVISIIIGPAGIGTMLLLNAFGLLLV
ncbi:MAG: hypothetical protein PHP82_04195 [Candidatus ainarchaeum sp.]|nr:hypothetical protein [Candidatus ainarchaeum sp.]